MSRTTYLHRGVYFANETLVIEPYATITNLLKTDLKQAQGTCIFPNVIVEKYLSKLLWKQLAKFVNRLGSFTIVGDGSVYDHKDLDDRIYTLSELTFKNMRITTAFMTKIANKHFFQSTHEYDACKLVFENCEFLFQNNPTNFDLRVTGLTLRDCNLTKFPPFNLDKIQFLRIDLNQIKDIPPFPSLLFLTVTRNKLHKRTILQYKKMLPDYGCFQFDEETDDPITLDHFEQNNQEKLILDICNNVESYYTSEKLDKSKPLVTILMNAQDNTTIAHCYPVDELMEWITKSPSNPVRLGEIGVYIDRDSSLKNLKHYKMFYLIKDNKASSNKYNLKPINRSQYLTLTKNEFGHVTRPDPTAVLDSADEY